MSNRVPVNIRNNVQSYEDPYIEEESLEEHSYCRQCGSVYMAGRWYLSNQVEEKKQDGPDVLCPACRKLRDKVPSGVLKITGSFVRNHKEEIINLIRNETGKAAHGNPLERVMSMESDSEGMHITTTNEKLAQKIGRALHKAYRGKVEYKWSADNRLARVNWHRDD